MEDMGLEVLLGTKLVRGPQKFLCSIHGTVASPPSPHAGGPAVPLLRSRRDSLSVCAPAWGRRGRGRAPPVAAKPRYCGHPHPVSSPLLRNPWVAADRGQ